MKNNQAQQRERTDKHLSADNVNPISIPDDWTPDLDIRYCRNFCFGDEDETNPVRIHSDICDSIASAVVEYNTALDLAIESLRHGSDLSTCLETLQPIWPQAKLEVLRVLAKQSKPELQEQILDEIGYCRAGMEIVHPIITRYIVSPDDVWLREMIDAINWMLSMVAHIETTFGVNVREFWHGGV